MKLKLLLPILLMLLFALTRIPGLMWWNFSAVYALVFCAGVYFPKKLAWWLPLATMAVTDLALNIYYHHKDPGMPLFSFELLGNYIAYVALIWLGRKFGNWTKPMAAGRKPTGLLARFAILVGGGILGAIIFYFVSNTFSWFFNIFNAPEYTKTLTGWLTALTKGMANYPFPIKMQTWELFRNTLSSGGLFTALFAGAMSLLEALAPEEQEQENEEPEAAPAEQPADQPEEAKA